jgi:hypothetical protein
VIGIVPQNRVGAVQVKCHAFLTISVDIGKWSDACSGSLSSCRKVYLSQYFDLMDSRADLEKRKILSPPGKMHYTQVNGHKCYCLNPERP